MSEPSCRKCGGRMRPGIATEQTYTGTPDFPGDTHVSTMSPGGPGAVIDCMKCEACGWSVTKGSLAMSDDVDKAEAWDAISAKNAEIARLREHLAEAERQRDVARAEALEEAAQCCDTEAVGCDGAVKWGGSRRYISDCKAAAYAMRNRAAAIRALIKKDRT